MKVIVALFCYFISVPCTVSAMYCNTKESIALPNANSICMPWINYGTGSSTKHRQDVAELTQKWLDVVNGTGIDTAWIYRDETQVGQGILASTHERNQVFLTTKLRCAGKGSKAMANTNIDQLNTKYVDLLLIHEASDCPNTPKGNILLEETWKVLVNELDTKRTKAIGVSNFELEDLMRLDKIATKYNVYPAVNQIKTYLGCMPSKEFMEYSRQKGIIVEAYSPLNQGKVLKNSTVQRVAKRYNRTPAQVAIQYLIQKNIVVVFTSSKEEYMRQNLQVVENAAFVIDAQSMKELDDVKMTCTKKYIPPTVTME